MNFKSSLGMAALEDLKEDNITNLNTGNEGWKGAFKGMVKGSIRSALQREKVEKEVAALKEKLKELEENISASKKSKGAKIANESLKAIGKGILQGAAWTGHKLEQAEKEAEALKKKIAEAEAEIADFKTRKKTVKAANESSDTDATTDTDADNTDTDADADTDTENDATTDADAATSAPASSEEGSTTTEATDTTTPQEGDATDTTAATDSGDGTADAAADASEVTNGTSDAAGDADADTTDATDSTDADTDADPVVGSGDADADADSAAATAAVADVDSTGDAAEVTGDSDITDAETEVVEEEMGSVDKIEDQAADVDDDVEKLNQATEALEGLMPALEAACQRGGFDELSSALLRNNLNTVTNSLKVRPLMIPALEDIISTSAKIDAAHTTKDQVASFLKRIIDSLKQAFQRFGEWITETYKRLTNAFVAIERRAEKLAEKAKSVQMKEGALANKALSAKMTVHGKVTDDLLGQLEKIAKAATYLNDPKSYNNYLEAIDLAEEMVKDPSKAEEVRGKISAVLAKWSSDVNKIGDSGYKASGQSGDTSAVNIGLLNGQTLEIIIPASAEALSTMRGVTSEGELASEDLQALSQADAIAICAKVSQLAKEIRESGEANRGGVKELIGEINKRKETLTALVNGQINTAVGDDGAAATAVRKAAVFLNTLFLTAPKLPVHAINKAMPRNLMAALDYVAASLGGKVEGDDAGDAAATPAKLLTA